MTEFTTKDSGARQEFASGMKRDTESGKPRFDLILPDGVPFEEQLLTRFAMLMSRGAEKYDARNWEKADSDDEVRRAKSSAFRHFMQWICGERDEDHAAAVMFNLMVVETIQPRVGAATSESPADGHIFASGTAKELVEAARRSADARYFLDQNAPKPVKVEHVKDALDRLYNPRTEDLRI